MAYGVYLEVMWVPSEVNPSDAPTRHMDLGEWLDENAAELPESVEAAAVLARDAADGAADDGAGLPARILRS